MSKSVEEMKASYSPEFYGKRIEEYKNHKRTLHHVIYVSPSREWKIVQENTQSILTDYLPNGGLLLDVGCGYGAVCEVLPDNVVYLGVEICLPLYELAQELHPGRVFNKRDVRTGFSEYADGYFDVALVRSTVDAINWYGEDTSETVKKELLRVCKIVIIQGYTEEYHTVMERKTNARSCRL